MAITYKDSKIMSNYITIDVGITDGNIDPTKTVVNFRNFRNLLNDGVIPLNDTSLSGNDIDIQLVGALFSSLLSIYECQQHLDRLAQDTKLQGAQIVKSE